MIDGMIDCDIYNGYPQLRDQVFYSGDDWMDIDD